MTFDQWLQLLETLAGLLAMFLPLALTLAVGVLVGRASPSRFSQARPFIIVLKIETQSSAFPAPGADFNCGDPFCLEHGIFNRRSGFPDSLFNLFNDGEENSAFFSRPGSRPDSEYHEC